MKKQLSDFEVNLGKEVLDDENYYGIILHVLERRKRIYYLIGYDRGIRYLKHPNQIAIIPDHEIEYYRKKGFAKLHYSKLVVGAQFTINDQVYADRNRIFTVNAIDEYGCVYFYDETVYKKVAIEATVSLEC